MVRILKEIGRGRIVSKSLNVVHGCDTQLLIYVLGVIPSISVATFDNIEQYAFVDSGGAKLYMFVTGSPTSLELPVLENEGLSEKLTTPTKQPTLRLYAPKNY